MVVNRFNSRPKRRIDKVILVGSFVILYSIMTACLVAAWVADPVAGLRCSVTVIPCLAFLTLRSVNECRSYVEVQEDTVRVVDARLFKRREALISLKDVAYATVRYSRYGSYILFKDPKKKTLFYVHFTPQTEEFFKEYLNTNK